MYNRYKRRGWFQCPGWGRSSLSLKVSPLLHMYTCIHVHVGSRTYAYPWVCIGLRYIYATCRCWHRHQFCQYCCSFWSNGASMCFTNTGKSVLWKHTFTHLTDNIDIHKHMLPYLLQGVGSCNRDDYCIPGSGVRWGSRC